MHWLRTVTTRRQLSAASRFFAPVSTMFATPPSNKALLHTSSTASTTKLTSTRSSSPRGPSLFGSSLSDVEMIAANNRNLATQSEMKDEYGAMDDSGDTFALEDYQLESGQVLAQAQLRYRTYGQLNAAADNVVVVCHALTGNASLHAWWGDLLGDGAAFDTSKYFIVCCNILGSCYGSTSPASVDPRTGQPYGLDFPDVSVGDTVRLQLLLLKHIGVRSVKAVIGGSFGGMQAVEFAVQAGSETAEFTDERGRPYVRSVIPIACGAAHTAWQIGISEVQRQAIYKDPMWSVDPFQALSGLEIARQLGMISYRTASGYHTKFGRSKQEDTSPEYGSDASWKVKSYLEYQGQKFLGRFDPVTYVKMTEQMDSHDVSRGRGTLQQVLGGVEIPALVLGIDSDVLYPLSEQEQLAELLGNADLAVIHSEDGHDGFLLEQEQVGAHISDFLSRHE